MPSEVNQNKTPATIFRPPQEILDVFWSLSDGTDDDRTNGAVKLCKLIANSEKDVKNQILKYCKERLIRGLSSGRKFARVGFSIALAQLLRQFDELQITDILDTVKDKLRYVRQDKKSKAEIGGIFLGRAFAFSTIIQSGRISQLSEEELDSVIKELLKISDKKSYLNAISNRIIEDLLHQISPKIYEDQVWPKLKAKLEEGWEFCTLDKISLLLTCRDTFPDVTKKKFLRKHWGLPLFSEDNDDKLIKAILGTTQKSDILLNKVLPYMINSKRDVLSIWKSIGEKLTASHSSDKKKDSLARRQHVGLQMAGKLLKEELSVEQVTDFILSPNFARCLFYVQTKKSCPHASIADDLCEQICLKLKSSNADILELVEKIWKLQSSLSEGEKSGQVNLVSSHNFFKIMDLMTTSQAESYVKTLTSTIKGKDKWQILSDNPKKQLHQLECCLRHLQHLTCSQQHTTAEMQKSVLSLFLRLACFRVEKKTKNIQHCERCCNYDTDDSRQKLCETAFYKCLDSLSTLKSNHQSKWEQFSGYLQLLFHLVEYIQTLLSADTVTPIKTWPEEIKTEWDKLFALVSKIKEEIKEQKDVSLSSAFLLLFLFLGILMLTDFKNSMELLKDVYICYEKANAKKKKKTKDEDNEPDWVEVVTEVLLSLLLLPSHLGRVITTAVFKSMLDHITPSSVGLITDVLIPKKTGADDAGGVLVDAGMEDEDDDDDEEEDVDEMSSDEDDDKSDKEDMEAEEEDKEEETVDESFRQSVKEALGKAAVDKDDDTEENDEDLPDLSDSEMFKLDDMLAEVFRQRKMAGGKKAREEKRKETDNFRIRVLDLVEALIKSERCGDSLVDLLKPILLLMLKTNPLESQIVCDKAKQLFILLKSKAKGQKDSVHSEEQHKNIFIELIELAQSVVDANHMRSVSSACFTVMNLSCGDKITLPSQYVELLKETLQNVIKKPKNNLTFFTALIELDPVKFHVLAPDVLNHLQDETTKTHSKMICCSILASLAKKTGALKDEDKKKLKKWMKHAASAVQQLILSLDKQTPKVMLTNSILSLAIALQSRTDIFKKPPFDVTVSKHLQDLKPSFNTDPRRLANKIIASIEKSQPKGETKNEKKRKNDQVDEVKSDSSSPAKKKRKL